MMKDKAYKLLAVQEGISNAQAKKLIDNGSVFVSGVRLKIARESVDTKSVFKVEKQEKVEVIYEDNELFAINKPRNEESYDLERRYKLKLVHRLDKPTSGVLLFAKSDEFLQKAIEAFRAREVEKKYLAVVDGIISEEIKIDLPIFTIKSSKAKSVVDKKRGLEAITIVRPLQVVGKRTLLEIGIVTGRTHQIRAHLAHIGYAILGDSEYGGREFKRLMLHSYYISILGRTITAKMPSEFRAMFSDG